MTRWGSRLLVGGLITVLVACTDGDPAPRTDTSRARVDPATIHDARLRQAIVEAEAAVTTGRPSARDWGRLGHVYLAHDFEHPALDAYQRARRLEPESARWWYFVGLATNQVDPGAAAVAFAEAARRDPTNVAALMRAGYAYKEVGEYGQARQAFTNALSVDDGLAAAELGLGQVLLEQGSAEDALHHFERALALQPAFDQARAGLARVYLALGDARRASEYSRDLRQISSQRTWSDPLYDEIAAAGVSEHWIIKRANAALRSGRYAAAVAQFAKLATPEQSDAAIWSDYGASLLGAGRYAEAERSARRALEIMQRDGGENRYAPRIRAAVHTNLGIALVRQGRHEDAVESFRAALQADPESAAAAASLARLTGGVDAAAP